MEAYKQMITASSRGGHRLFQPVHRRARQLPENVDRRRRHGPRQSAGVRSVEDEFRHRRFRRSPQPKAWKEIWGSGQGVGSVARVVPAAELIARFKKEYDEAIDPPL